MSFDDDDSQDVPERYFDVVINNRLFEASVMAEPYTGQVVFSIGKGSLVNMRGCVVITFDTEPEFTEAQLEWFGYDADCTKDRPDMDRGQSKSMLIGTLLAFRKFVEAEYPHVQTLILSDEAVFKCTPGSAINISTMVPSLFLHGKTYYQRLLNVQPYDSNMQRRFQLAIAKMNEPAADAKWFKRILKSRADRAFSDIISRALDINRGTWKDVVNLIYAEAGCPFFEAYFGQLSDMFSMTALLGSTWCVPLNALPSNVTGHPVTFDMNETTLQVGGGHKLGKAAKFARIRAASKHFKNARQTRIRNYRRHRTKNF